MGILHRTNPIKDTNQSANHPPPPFIKSAGEPLFNYQSHETAIKPPNKRLLTYETYNHMIECHLIPSLGGMRWQQLRATDIKRYYNDTTLSPTTLEQHHTLLHSALKAAQLKGLVQRNVASLVIGKPHRPERRQDVMQHCWDAEEARRFLSAAKAHSPQAAAF
ncbi:MAG: hypothetical protein ACRDH2_18210 [Anaerolineales bacterium]